MNQAIKEARDKLNLELWVCTHNYLPSFPPSTPVDGGVRHFGVYQLWVYAKKLIIYQTIRVYYVFLGLFHYSRVEANKFYNFG